MEELYTQSPDDLNVILPNGRAEVELPLPAAFDGSSLTLRASKLDEISELVEAISSVLATIVTVSDAPPTSNSTLYSVAKPRRTSRSVTVLVLKPFAVTVIE